MSTFPRAVPRALRFASALSLLVFACSNEPSGPTAVPSSAVEDATLTSTTAVSIGRVGVSGLPAPASSNARQASATTLEVGDVTAVFTADGADELRITLEHDADGWYFIAPLHSVDPLRGGTFQTYLTDGKARSKTQSLTVDPLPEAPGAFAAAVAKAREHLELLATSAGTSIDELKAATPDTLDPILLPLKLSQSYLDDEADPNDMTDLAVNAGGFLSADEADLLDRLFGEFELETLLQMRIDELVATTTQFPEAAAMGNRFASGTQRSASACIQARIPIDNAADLSWRMTYSRVYEIGADPESEAGQILVRGSEVITTAGALSAAASLPATVAGTLIATVQSAVGFVAGIMPSKFTGIDYEVNKTEFNEDSITPGTYSHVEVVAESDGWVADESIANTAVTMFGPNMTQAARLQTLNSPAFANIGSQGLGAAVREFFGNTSIIEFCPEVWVVDITGAPYSTATTLNGLFSVDITSRAYRPLMHGADVLQVGPNPGYFGGRIIVGDVDLLVREIVVTLIPGDILVENPGETVGFDGTIANADITKLAWVPEFGTWVDGFPDTTDGAAVRLLKTPAAADAYPFDVVLWSTSRQGPRASGNPARFATATLRLQAQTLIVEPGFACLKNNATQQFQATLEGGGQPDVTWEVAAGPGSIDANGLYTAPGSGLDDVTIRAYVTDDESLESFATVNIGACDCWMKVTVTGDSEWSYEGPDIAYFILEGEIPFYQFNYRFPVEETHSVGTNIWGGQLDPTPAIGETGLFSAGVNYSSGELGWTPAPGGFFVTITKHGGSYMEGYFHGDVYRYDQFGEIISTVSILVEFRALRYAYLVGEWPCP